MQTLSTSKDLTDARPITPAAFEALLACVASRTSNPLAGIYGPDSMSWRINRESALFVGAGRAALLQLAHPWVAAALRQHSSLLNRPIARFHNTFRIVFTMVFGSLHQALAAAQSLYSRHTRITGQLAEDTGAWRRGDHYQANEAGALLWVYATLVESAVIACEAVHGPIALDDRERYYAETNTLAALFGIPGSALPPTWSAFSAYIQAMNASDLLGATADARRMARNLLAGAGSWIRSPGWYSALTASWLPQRFREEFALSFGPAEQRAAERAAKRLSAIYRRLPAAIRFIGPWHEAQARLAGRPPGSFTRFSNRFWIGESRMPFVPRE